MNKPRELFVPIDIKATSGIHSLLKNNKVPVIGYITHKKRYTKGGGCIVPKEICFHFGTMHSDFFYFENMTLVYQAVSIKTPEYITSVYADCAKKKNIEPNEFIEMVLETYVMKKMGF